MVRVSDFGGGKEVPNFEQGKTLSLILSGRGREVSVNVDKGTDIANQGQGLRARVKDGV